MARGWGGGESILSAGALKLRQMGLSDDVIRQFADGKTDVKTLLLIKDWDFAWQDRYFFRQPAPLPKGTRLDVEIHWDNSAENPRNPSSPPIRVTWGEESRDEMGSISLMAVPREESDLATLQGDVNRRANELARSRMQSDPTLAKKVAQLLAE